MSTPRIGFAVAAAIIFLVGSALWSLLTHVSTADIAQLFTEPYYLHVTKFSFYQATLSALFSVGLAIPIAHALSRRRFVGKALLLKLFASTLVLPVLVGVFGLLAIYGNRGLFVQGLNYFGNESSFSIYGLNGILLAHIFFNLPYATRLILQALESIPHAQHKLSAHLGMGHWHKFRWIEWPFIKQQLPHIAGLVFMLCFTSFATVMALGGGPKATTIELAIYQAIKFDFDLQTGALLAIWQIILCGIMTLVIQSLAKPLEVNLGTSLSQSRHEKDSWLSKCWDGFWIFSVLLFVLPPLIVVVFSGLNKQTLDVLSSASLWHAFTASIQIALMASSIALLSGVAILITSRRLRLSSRVHSANGIELIGTIILVTPGLVLSTGIFLLFRMFTDVFSLAMGIVVIVNAMMGLPYVIKTLAQPMLHVEQQYQYLCSSLGLSGLNRLKVVEWPALRKPLAHAFSISFMFAFGDLSAVALFGSQDFRTLPLYLFQLLGSYQMEAAAVVSLLLLCISLSCFALIETLFRSNTRKNHA